MIPLEQLKRACLIGILTAVIFASIYVLMFSPNVIRHRKNYSIKPLDSRYYEKTGVKEISVNGSCKSMLQKPADTPLNAQRGVHLLAAVPGSGSDWSLITISSITGHNPDRVLRYIKKHKDAKQLLNTTIYYKTHFPFSLHTKSYNYFHFNRTMVLVRNPFDAGFPEYIRKTLRRTVKSGGQSGKYAGVEELSSLVFLSQPNSSTPSTSFAEWITTYYQKWEIFHKYWFEMQNGSVEFVLYQNLVDDKSKFTEITSYFGFNATLTSERRQRLNCYYKEADKMETIKRPHSEVVDSSKETLRIFYALQTADAVAYVEKLINQKFQKNISVY